MSERARELLAHAKNDLDYVDGLEAHLDEDGQIGTRNVSDLIAMIRWNAEQLIEALSQSSPTGMGEVRAVAERVVAENIVAWGWGPIDDIEGLSEHTLVVNAAEAGYRAALALHPTASVAGEVAKAIKAKIVPADGYEPMNAWDSGRYSAFKEAAAIAESLAASFLPLAPLPDVVERAAVAIADRRGIKNENRSDGMMAVFRMDAEAALAVMPDPREEGEEVGVPVFAGQPAGAPSGLSPQAVSGKAAHQEQGRG